MTDYTALREQLAARLRALTQRLENIEGDLGCTPDPDSEERAIELENEEVLERLDARGRRELQEIRAALTRIEAGTYGVCSKCGDEIGTKRLTALPTTNLCVRCAA